MTTRIERACEVDLGSLSYTTRYTAGVGELVRDGNTIVGQIVGNTFYVFLRLSEDIFPVLGIRGGGVRLYERILALIWNQYRGPLPPPQFPESTSDELRDAVATWAPKALAQAEENTKRAEDALREAEAQYRKRLSDLVASRVVEDGLRAFPSRVVEYLGDDDAQRQAWEELRAHPSFVSISVVEGGINLVTKPLALTYDGRRYPLGSFVLRLNVSGDLFVWCSNSPHPQRVPHPHISAAGDMCYGNMALTIERTAFVERNFPKVFRLALELLTEGYDPKTTITPITEWPEERTDA
jgi:hypothetical protein